MDPRVQLALLLLSMGIGVIRRIGHPLSDEERAKLIADLHVRSEDLGAKAEEYLASVGLAPDGSPPPAATEPTPSS